MIESFQQHPFAWFIGYVVFANFVSALPAPKANATQFYMFFFRFMNGLGANLSRAFSTTIEKSPNWLAAVDKLGVPAASQVAVQKASNA